MLRLDAWAVTQHLICCGTGGGWLQLIAHGITWALAMCYNDVGVQCKAEVLGLSETSAYRPVDLVSGLIDTPLEFDAGRTEKHAVDTTETYASGSARSLSESLCGEQQRPAAEASQPGRTRRRSTRCRRLSRGNALAGCLSTAFIPAGISSRGVMGESMEKLLDWLSDYGVKNCGVLGSLGEEGAQVNTVAHQEALDPAHLDRAAPDHDGGCLYRALDIKGAASRRRGGPESLSAIDLRFGGSLGLV